MKIPSQQMYPEGKGGLGRIRKKKQEISAEPWWK
jgi:hypothetical protein